MKVFSLPIKIQYIRTPFIRLEAGIFEEMFSGIGGEILFSNLNQDLQQVQVFIGRRKEIMIADLIIWIMMQLQVFLALIGQHRYIILMLPFM